MLGMLRDVLPFVPEHCPLFSCLCAASESVPDQYYHGKRQDKCQNIRDGSEV